MLDLPGGLRAMLSETPLPRDTVFVLADWLEQAGDASADGVRHAVSWARQMGVDAHGLWAEARVGRVPYLMRWIPAGLGRVTTLPPDSEWYPRQPRPTAVRTAVGYWLGATPVTEGQWRGVMPDGFLPDHGADCPMVEINRQDVDVFLTRQNANRHHPYRLPSHHEWEFAARAGSPFATGQPPGASLERVAWYGDAQRRAPWPVARKAPNAFGIYDALGNVYEFCADLLAPAGRRATCQIRGACWMTAIERVRLDWHGTASMHRRALATGFRLALGEPVTFAEI